VDYLKIHDDIVSHFRLKYGEHSFGKGKPNSEELLNHHHIMPKHVFRLNGLEIDNSSSNCVWVPYRYHRLLHKLLYKIHGNVNDLHAYNLMYGLTEEAKRAAAILGGKARLGSNLSDETKLKQSMHVKTSEHRINLSNALKGNKNGEGKKGSKSPLTSVSNNKLLLDIETGIIKKRSAWYVHKTYKDRKPFLMLI